MPAVLVPLHYVVQVQTETANHFISVHFLEVVAFTCITCSGDDSQAVADS